MTNGKSNKVYEKFFGYKRILMKWPFEMNSNVNWLDFIFSSIEITFWNHIESIKAILLNGRWISIYCCIYFPFSDAVFILLNRVCSLLIGECQSTWNGFWEGAPTDRVCCLNKANGAFLLLLFLHLKSTLICKRS